MRAIRSALFPGLGVLLALVLIAPPPAHAAQGVNLTWSRCFGEGVGTQNRAFACDTNDGSEWLVVSFVLPADVAQAAGNEIVIDMISQDDPIPLWWDFHTAGSCRMTSLAMNTIADANNVVCVDWAQGASLGGIGAYDQTGVIPTGGIDPSLTNVHRRLKIALAVPLAGLQDLVANTEYFACNIVIDHRKTIGTGACGGCAGSVCLLLQSFRVATPAASGDLILFGGTTPGSDMAHWQGSGADCNLVPVKNKTWAEVKALYR
jgi:hypothetical protein